MNIDEGKKLIEQKVEDFHNRFDYYTSKDFQEEENRSAFIEPFFTALGWEFNQTDLPYHFWDVHREERQKSKNRNTQKPDYAFRSNGKLKFYLEAKAPWVPLTAKDPVFQAKGYAFSTNGKAPIVILTDFEEFRVFNAIERPIYENPLQDLIKKYDFRYTDYLENWDLIYNTFSREAVTNGSLYPLIGKVTKNTKTLDKEFLEDLIQWREQLARHIAVRNKDLSVKQLNESVQRILDRLIFVRNLEDREVEDIILSEISKKKENVYKELIPVFSDLDKDYNGLLFKKHFSEELIIDDNVIKKIIKNLYHPYSPYQFDVIEPEILGRIYENFLGSKIRLTENHQAKVEEKPEVRHAGGVYYTPEYIVDAIVAETIGNHLKGKKPEQIAKVKILDPACGSGSFLIGAFSYLMEYHKQFYSKNQGIKKYQKDYFITPEGELKLTIKKKGDILFNNIFGVDIDREATEVSIMSLYLKLLEEGFDSEYKKQAVLFMKGLILPDMNKNILCGNSLISREELFVHDMFGDDDIQPFDWRNEKEGFGGIFRENGGFDCIIGNPPYIRIQEMIKWAPKTIEIYNKTYESGGFKNYDMYVLFIEKLLKLLNQNGRIGFILPNKFMKQNYGKPIRKILSENKFINKIVDFKDFQVFKGATTYTCLLYIQNKDTNKFNYAECLSDNLPTNFSSIESSWITKDPWILHKKENIDIMNKMEQNKKLGDIAESIFVGIQTSADNVFILNLIKNEGKHLILRSKSLEREVRLESTFLRHIISGTDVKRFKEPQKRQYVIYPYEIVNGKAVLFEKSQIEKETPLIWEYFLENRKILEARERGKYKGKDWYRFGRNQNINKQHLEKICVPRLVQKIQSIYDDEGAYCQDNVDVGGVILKEEYKDKYYYLIGILNSDLLSFYLSKISTPFRGGFWSCNKQYLEKLPIYIPNMQESEKYASCAEIEKYAMHIVQLKKIGKEADAEFLEKKIDELVKKIYLG